MDGMKPTISIEYKCGDIQLAVDIRLEPEEDITSEAYYKRVLSPALRSLETSIDLKHGRPTRTERLIQECAEHRYKWVEY
jgi:hypothetical protein